MNTFDKMQSIKEKFPIGMKVRVTESYDEDLVGVVGEVVDHECGGGEFSAPMAVVRYIRPEDRRQPPKLDTCSFYDDEIAPVKDALADAAVREKLVKLARQIGNAMNQIVELARDHDVNHFMSQDYPKQWGSLDEVASDVHEWAFQMSQKEML